VVRKIKKAEEEMEQLPKIVRQRLEATAKPSAHPDPDTLTAFAEQSLSERERVPVLQHLARCADCREILAIAQPQVEFAQAAAAAMVAPDSVRSNWLRRPRLGWATAAACVLVLGATVTLRYGARSKSSPPAAVPGSAEIATYAGKPPENEASPEQSKAQPGTSAVEPSPKAIAALRSEVGSGASAEADKHPPRSKVMEKKTLANPLRSSPYGSARGRSAVAGAAGAPLRPRVISAAPPPPTSKSERPGALAAYDHADEIRVGTSDSAQPDSPKPGSAAKETTQVTVAMEAADSSAEKVAVQGKPAESKNAPQGGIPQTQYGRLSASNSVLVAPGLSRSDAQKEAMQRTASNLIMPRWTLSSDGSLLLRSLDAGKTWEMITVASKTTFRAVAAFGPEVWAAGSGGALYHSADLGQHWTQVRPTADGKALTEDIVRIEVTDAPRLQLTTASGLVWTTMDGGQRWQVK
jgi:hypothetical protein